jgi:hypothetical protein
MAWIPAILTEIGGRHAFLAGFDLGRSGRRVNRNGKMRLMRLGGGKNRHKGHRHFGDLNWLPMPSERFRKNQRKFQCAGLLLPPLRAKGGR